MSMDRAHASRVPPYSQSAEQAVLGCIFRDGQALSRIQGGLSPSDFYLERHALIFRTCLALTETGAIVDFLTVSERLDRIGELDAVGGVAYLGEVANCVFGSGNIEYYAKIVNENSVLRQLIGAGARIVDSVRQRKEQDAGVLVDAAEREVLRISEKNARAGLGFESIGDLIGGAIEHLQRLYDRDDPIVGIPSGFVDLDRLTAGFQKSDLVIVAARPAMGKTAFALGLGARVALESKTTVGIFSLEMPGEQLVLRMFSALAHLDFGRMRTGKLRDEEWAELAPAIDRLAESRMFIDSTPALTPADLRARARRLARDRGPLGMVVVDYLQLMRVPELRNNRVAEVSEISRSLKALAKELDCPVIALSQLNRGLEQRPNKRPTMSDLRDSGAIEQDADMILFIYRDEVYNEESPDRGVAEIIIGKQRNGPTGKVSLAFIGQEVRFANLAR
jgi:replicative DNA helicase